MAYLDETNARLTKIYEEHLERTQALLAEELKRSFKNGLATARNRRNSGKRPAREWEGGNT